MIREAVQQIRIALLGAGGLGKAAARIVSMKHELRLTVVCDSRGVVASAAGVSPEMLSRVSGDLVDGVRRAQQDGLDPSTRAPALAGEPSLRMSPPTSRRTTSGEPRACPGLHIADVPLAALQIHRRTLTDHLLASFSAESLTEGRMKTQETDWICFVLSIHVTVIYT